MTVDVLADLSDITFWERPHAEREAAFAALRAVPEPQFFKELKVPFVRAGSGFYALTRHAEVVEASRKPEIFSSEPCSVSVPDMPGYLARYLGSMINMDDPRHAKIRRIVSRAFTPRMLTRLESDLERSAARIVDDVLARGQGDFVAEVAARLPVQVICDMMGIPEDRRAMVLHRTNIILGISDVEYGGIQFDKLARVNVLRGIIRLMSASRDLHRLAMGLGRERRKNPGDDLVSALVNANIDGEHLSDQELGSFFILLVAAGNETTRNAISHGLKLFTDHPDQRQLLQSDFDAHIGGAVEEIVRYATPVIAFRRTLTTSYEMSGHLFQPGDKVLLCYNSANRDAAVFERPDEFDITRDPNPHVGFGGPGPHFCLGANLARREITVMFRELFSRAPDIHTVGRTDRLLSFLINGVKRMGYEVR